MHVLLNQLCSSLWTSRSCLYILADLISFLEIQRLQPSGSSSTVFKVNLIHKTIPTQQHTGEPTIVSPTLRNTPQNNTHRTTHRRTNNGFCNTKKHSTRQYQHNNTQANQQWFPQHQETLHKTIPTQKHTGQPTMVSATPRNTLQNNTHTTTHRPTNNSFYNTKKHSTKQ